MTTIAKLHSFIMMRVFTTIRSQNSSSPGLKKINVDVLEILENYANAPNINGLCYTITVIMLIGFPVKYIG